MPKTKRHSKPVTLTMRPIFREKANTIMDTTGEKISELVRRLINEEHERRSIVKLNKTIHPK